MRRGDRRFFRVAAFGALLGAPACGNSGAASPQDAGTSDAESGSGVCAAGGQLACTCPNGAQGTESCLASGLGYGTCMGCPGLESGTGPEDSGADGVSNAEAGGRADDSGTEAGPDGGPVAPSVAALASMVLAFDDEFNGPANSQPDTTKWQFSFTGSSMIDYGGGEWIDVSLPHLDGSGHCVLPGQYTGGGVTNPANYSAGCIITKGGQAGTGYAVVPTSTNRVYMEWRAQLPAPGAGVWPALWAISNGSPYTEVDIMEQGTGIGPTPPFDAYFTYWTGPNLNTLTKVAGLSYHASGSPSLAADYHVYSSLWTTADVTWYIDGAQAGTAAIPATNQGPVAPIANFQIGNGGGGTPDGTGWPRDFTIDYVRIFRDQ